MNWRLIEQQTYSAPMNMAVDHAIYESVANGRELPTIRFYKWLNNYYKIILLKIKKLKQKSFQNLN